MECEIFTMFFHHGELHAEDLDEKVFAEHFARICGKVSPDYLWLKHIYVKLCVGKHRTIGKKFWLFNLCEEKLEESINCIYEKVIGGEKIDNSEYEEIDYDILRGSEDVARKYLVIRPEFKDRWELYLYDAIYDETYKTFDIIINVLGISSGEIIECIRNMDTREFYDCGRSLGRFVDMYNNAINYLRKR